MQAKLITEKASILRLGSQRVAECKIGYKRFADSLLIFVARQGGIEPPTYCLEGNRSWQNSKD